MKIGGAQIGENFQVSLSMFLRVFSRGEPTAAPNVKTKLRVITGSKTIQQPMHKFMQEGCDEQPASQTSSDLYVTAAKVITTQAIEIGSSYS